jgi:hypothetical protein
VIQRSTETARVLFPAAESAARELIDSGGTTEVRFAVASAADGDVQDRIVSAEGSRVANAPVDWLCAGKPALAHAAVHALCAAGLSIDDDLRPLVAATDAWRPVTLREILTYRSGFTAATGRTRTRCVEEPPLARPADWDPLTDARYWNAGWELLPSVVANATGLDFATYLSEVVMRGHFGAGAVAVHRGAGRGYHDRDFIADPQIRGVFIERGLATAAVGPLGDLARFLLGVAVDVDADGPWGEAARLLISANPGPDFFATGVSDRLRWALGFPHRLIDQGFERIAAPDAFGAQGAVLAHVGRRLRYAWVVVSGAFPSLGAACAVAMTGLRPVPDDRYRRMVGALLEDLSGHETDRVPRGLAREGRTP